MLYSECQFVFNLVLRISKKCWNLVFFFFWSVLFKVKEFFFLMWAIVLVFIKCVTILVCFFLLFYFLTTRHVGF